MLPLVVIKVVGSTVAPWHSAVQTTSNLSEDGAELRSTINVASYFSILTLNNSALFPKISANYASISARGGF